MWVTYYVGVHMATSTRAGDKGCTPSSSVSFLEDIVKALQDEAVINALRSIFEKKLTNSTLQVENNGLKRDLAAAYDRIENLENYSKKSNLIITGVPVTSYAEVISSQQRPTGQPTTLKPRRWLSLSLMSSSTNESRRMIFQ